MPAPRPQRSLVALAAAIVMLVGAGCGYGSEPTAARNPPTTSPPTGAPTFGHGTVIIDKGRDTVLVSVEVADTSYERRYGLMFRKSLPPDAGMVFIYFSEERGSFWMKNTRIPLSIAFFDKDGTILRILDMAPCRRDPCKLYNPGVPYWGALEVNRGAFQRWGIEEGDTISLAR
jgi:uncharacterized membrane protein (UPF0127 family)